MTREPNEKPTNVMGLAPRFLSTKESAKIRPAALARPHETVQGLSMRYESLVKMMGRVREAISAVKIVLARTCCSP